MVTPEQLSFPVTIVGAGGIGSPTALTLAKMGCPQITIYDPDTIEQHNLPNQLYRLADVGQPKVKALQAIIHEFTDCEVNPVAERLVEADLSGVVISAVDSMAERQSIWQGSIRYRIRVDLYVDARMGAEVSRVFSVRPTDPDDVRFYESTLYSDLEATEENCTARAIIYNVLNVASLVANIVKRHARGEEGHRELIFDFATMSLLLD
jgi:molybdopterin/thiamine biosynthesis adenylyltransferase